MRVTSKETKQKISKALKGIKHSKELKEKISKTLKGRKVTWGDKISKTKKGRKMSKEERKGFQKYWNSLKGHKHTKETKLLLSKKLKQFYKNYSGTEQIVKHHIYLKENSDKTMEMTRKQHSILHRMAYNYLVEREMIEEYLQWFKQRTEV